MKAIILSWFLITATLGLSQSSIQRWETALYEVKFHEQFVQETSIQCADLPLSKELISTLTMRCMEKEGIIELRFENDTLLVYHMEYVDLETIEEFIYETTTNFSHLNHRLLTVDEIRTTMLR